MTTDTKRKLIERLYIQGFNCQNVEVLSGFYALGAINHGVRIGRDGMAQVFRSLFGLFPDLSYELVNMVAEKDHVICQVVMRATHLGSNDNRHVYGGRLAGVAPTGKPVCVVQFHSFKIAGEKIIEHAAVRDDLGMLQQLGIVAAPFAE